MPPKLRRGTSVSRGNRVGIPVTSVDGEKPADLLAHIQKMTAKQMQASFDQLTNPSRVSCQPFLDNKDKCRSMIPIHEKKRVRLTPALEGDAEFVPATYATCERDEYIIWQAPHKDNYINLWRNVWQDNCKIIVCVSDKFSETDTALCYPYWPTKESSTLDIEKSRYKITTTKKTENKGFTVYDLSVESSDVIEITRETKEKSADTDEAPDDQDAKKPRQITLLHLESWAADAWLDVEILANFVNTLSKRETQVVRKSMDTFVPPVLIQGHEGINRCAVIWVATILMKDIEKRECFDVEDLVKKFSRIRPGAFYSRLHFCLTFAVAFRCAGLSGWINSEESKAKAKDIHAAYTASLKP